MTTIEAYEQEILRFKDAYYNQRPLVSDSEYDELVDRYHSELELMGRSLSTSVARSIGHPIRSRDTKVKHKIPMGSLDKVNNSISLEKFNKNISKDSLMIVMPKYNGIAIQIEVCDGVVVRATTRGDGLEGIDITEKVLQMNYKIPTFTGFLRGEIFIPNRMWETFPNKSMYKNQLNATIGVCNADFSQDYIPMYKSMCIVIYNMFNIDGSQIPTKEIFDTIKFYQLCMFWVYPISELSYARLGEIYAGIKDRIPVDGLVVMPLDGYIDYGSDLYPTNQIAVKFVGDTIVYEIDRIEWQISRRGKYTPDRKSVV